MKKTAFVIWMILFSAIAASGQNSTKKNNPEGVWKYEAPAAPYGYTAGTIDISKANGKYSASVTLAASNYKIAAENVSFEKGNFSCSVYIEGQNVKIGLKMDDNSKMTGTATYSEGEIPLTVTREKDQK